MHTPTPIHPAAPLPPDTQADPAALDALEAAAFAAWPAAHTRQDQGWTLRLDRGYTKRANSANAGAQAQELDDAALDALEAAFAQQGLAPVFRLCSFAAVPATEARLAQRGFEARDLSLVMTRPLGLDDALAGDAGPTTAPMPTNAAAHTPALTLRPDAATWLQDFTAASGKSGADQALHLQILQRIAHPCAWAVDAAGDVPRSVALGVRVGPHLGLFDIATHAAHQRQGHAARLCRGLLAWGQAQGAHTAFLQVAAANRGAIRLYQQLGFREAYRYHYLERPAPAA